MILDTAPIGMVTDTKLIVQVSDASIYVCRANFTPKNGFSYINELFRENKLPNPCIVINVIDMLKKTEQLPIWVWEIWQVRQILQSHIQIWK